MAKPGLLSIQIDPHHKWEEIRISSLFAMDAVPSASSKLVLLATDVYTPEKHYQYELLFQLEDVSKVDISQLNQALNALPALVDLALYERLNFDKRDGPLNPQRTDVVIKVGLTPKNDPEVFQDYHNWYSTEHIHRLKRVDGWKTGSRYQLFQQVGRKQEYAAPLVSIHQYEAVNGLGGVEWEKSVRTEWTMRVDSNKERLPHRRQFQVQDFSMRNPVTEN
ncbi:hypothetical protein N7448_004443 [Penicillium atrosanguineum]|nr:hypothetical protein N7448_004443 [Penicillium atrosanguineum]